MNKEIKEIYLSNLEWIKIYDNMGGVMGNTVFKDSMSYEEYQKLFKTNYFVLCNKDYITNLQEEKEDLQKRLNSLLEAHKICDEQNMDYSTRIDKAIEYTNKHWVIDDPIKFKNDLLDILKKRI